MKEFYRFSKMYGKTFWATRGALFALLAIIVVAGLLMAHIEDLPIVDGLYFAFITALTVGYGDIIPISLFGKALSIFIGYTGLIFVGLNVGIATVALRAEFGKGEKK